MRRAFADALVGVARRDPRVVLLTGDLGYQVLEPFSQEFGSRFFNVGVAEQNMVGLATGLAEGGLIPFVYSIITFAVMRPFEFIRNGPVQHRLPVRIVGVGSGFDYGMNGASHYGLEDIAVLRPQPGLTIVAPADHTQARRALEATWNTPGPVYYRLGNDEQTTVEGLDGAFEVGRLQTVREGRDLLMIAMGSLAADVVTAAAELERRDLSCAVAVLASVSPPPLDDLSAALQRFPVVMTVEAHSVTGGIGSLVSEVAAEAGSRCRVVRCGVQLAPDGQVGTSAYLRARHGLSVPALVARALNACGRRQG